MKRTRVLATGLIAWAVALATGVSAPASASTNTSRAGGNECVFARTISDFKVLDRNKMVIWAPTRSKAYLVELGKIETSWKDLYEQMQAHKLDAITIDPVRAIGGLKQLGRQYVGHISDALSTPVKRDVFSAPIPLSR